MLAFKSISAKDGYFISGDNSYPYTISSLLFDGKPAQKTYHTGWVLLDKKPSLVEFQETAKKENFRFVLKEPDLFPFLRISYKKEEVVSNIDETYLEDFNYNNEFSKYVSLYTYTWDTVLPKLVSLEFCITELKETEFDLNISTNRNPEYSLLTNITQPPILKQLFPCKLSLEQSYNIIRSYVKSNINPKYAAITSDYDFCLTVKKKLELDIPEEYEIDVNSFSFRKRKPKYEKRFRKHREVDIFRAAPKSYQDYPLCIQFEGTNLIELEANIQTYLTNLMVLINEPIRDCPHCHGNGVLI